MLSILARLFNRRASTAAATPALVREYIRRKDFKAVDDLLRTWPRSNTEQEAEWLALRGEAHYHQHHDADAEPLFRKALALDPGFADAHYGLSLLLTDPGVAAGHAQFAVNKAPTEARYLAQLGYLHLQLGNVQAAEAALGTATKLNPDDAHAWNNQGIALRSKGLMEAARQCFDNALRLNPGHEQARQNLAQLDADTSTAVDDAPPPTVPPLDIDDLERQWSDAPEDVALAVELAGAYRQHNDFDSAANVLELALDRHPGEPRLRGAYGTVQCKRREFKAALPHLEAAVAALPDDVELLLQLAACHSYLEKPSRSMPLIERARQIAPDDVQVLSKYLAALINLCRYDEALAVAEQLEQRHIQTDCTGMLYTYLGRNDEALAWLNERLSVQPNEAGLRFQRAQLLLSQLDFEQGWQDYAYRGLGDSRNLRVLPFPLWKGEPLAGKRLIVLAEQGLGDQVMFASCLPDVLAMQPAELIVEAHERIASTLARSFPQCRVIPTRQNKTLDWVRDCGAVDAYIPLADLPLYLRRSVADFPRHTGYLVANELRRAHWAAQLPRERAPVQRSRRPRIGLSWRGGTEGTRTFIRSIDPAWLGPLSRVVEADWISLQYGDVSEELPRLREAGMPEVAHFADAIRDLDEFAALVSTLDLVITVCNTTVHYAGALGVPVWVLSPHVPEWRYGLTNPSMPWYPSSRLLRCNANGHWPATLSRVADELRAGVAPRGES